jgi:glutaconate CoA-transferase subunit A
VESVRTWLDEWVYGLKDHNEYLGKLGNETHERLKVEANYSEKINYGEY